MAVSELLKLLRSPAADARIAMRWWWFGPAADRAEIDRQLTAMSQAGIGGIELAVVYPLCRDGQIRGIVNQPYLSKAFLEHVRFAAERASELGMWMDVTLGSGWPYGGPHIPREKAGRTLRVESVPINAGESSVRLPETQEGDRFLAAVAVDLHSGETVVGEVSVGPDGRARLSAPCQKDMELRLLVSAPSAGRVKNAAVGAEGPWIDHYDADALRRHLDVVAKPLVAAAAGRERLRAVFCDSLEVSGANWTESLFSEFERRRGYRLEPHLPALFAGEGDAQKRIRHDYGQTLTEMLNENFLKPLREFARDNGLLSRVQAYGQPPADISSYKHVDIPEGEAARASDAQDIRNRADWTEITANRLASSAARQQGKNIVSAETWTWLHSPPFAATPLDMKSEADQYFLQGINRLVGHGWPYSPAKLGRPGWMFYAAANFNDNNPWFPVMGEVCRYLRTLSAALSMGERTGCLAVYAPVHDIWAGYRVENRMPDLVLSGALKRRIGDRLPIELLRMGYNFDLIDDEGIAELSKGTGPDYAAVILPNVERLPLQTARALEGFAGRGTVVAVGRLPDRSPGHLGAQSDSAEVKRLMSGLFSGGNACFFDVPAELGRLRQRVRPDVAFERPRPDIGYIHRTTPQGEIYFFANTGNEAVNVEAVFRFDRKNVWRFDPIADTCCPLATGLRPGERTLRLSFEPCESYFVVATDDGDGTPAEWRTEESFDISRDWDVCFSGMGLAKRMDKLESWTASPETRHYSGEAVYRKRVDLPADFLQNGRKAALTVSGCAGVEPFRTHPEKRNMGHIAFVDTPVKDAATVFVNGKKAGALWATPYRVDVTGLLHPGENRIELRVYNRLVNHIASLEFDRDAGFAHPFGRDFRGVVDLDRAAPEPSGLTGRIEIAALAAIPETSRPTPPRA